VTTGAPGVDALYAWSDAWRPLPAAGFSLGDAAAQHGGYLPVLDVLAAVLRTGWRGLWSYEVRSRTCRAHRGADEGCVGVLGGGHEPRGSECARTLGTRREAVP
jgi:hypothetical protein